MKVTVTVSRKSVMGITEGISATIAQHNGGTPSFNQLWASASEGPKLDIYYREGIGDLERRIEKWLVSSSGQFDLQSDGDDYKLTLNLSQYWPKRLTGLLKNKIQDYLVHTVTAGWLSDFDGLTVKQDYAAMGAQDLSDIVYIVGLKEFGFAEQERGTDSGKDADALIATVAERGGSDAAKDDNDVSASAGDRHGKSDTEADDGGTGIEAVARGEDDDAVDVRPDWTDWSGEGIANYEFGITNCRHNGHIRIKN